MREQNYDPVSSDDDNDSDKVETDPKFTSKNVKQNVNKKITSWGGKRKDYYQE